MKRIACSARLINFLPQSFQTLILHRQTVSFQEFPEFFLKDLVRKTVGGLGTIFEDRIFGRLSSISDPLVCGLRRPEALVLGGLAASLVIRATTEKILSQCYCEGLRSQKEKSPLSPQFYSWLL